VNSGEYRFVPVDAKTVRYGLGAVKGTGESAIAANPGGAEGGRSVPRPFDFCNRVDKRAVNRRVVEALVRAGAFDFSTTARACTARACLASVGVALEAAGQAERNAMQTNLFGGTEGAQHRPALVAAPRWTDAQRLREEKTALGFYLSGHPFSEHRVEIGKFVKAKPEERRGFGRIRGHAHPAHGRRGRIGEDPAHQQGRMVILNLSDGTATQEVICIQRGVRPVTATSPRRTRSSSSRRKCAACGARWGRRARRCSRASRRADLRPRGRAQPLRALGALVDERPGFDRRRGLGGEAQEPARALPQRPVLSRVRYRTGGASVEMQLGDDWRVNLDDALMQSLNDG